MLTQTQRLIITELTPEMAEFIQMNSMDDDTLEFVPDEVFSTTEAAAETIAFLISRYDRTDAPLVYAVNRNEDNRNLGYVQLVPLADGGWEIGYHIGKTYTGKGYATEAVSAFLPVIAEKVGTETVYGISRKDNAASCRVLEKCGFEPFFVGVGNYQGKRREIVKTIWKRY